MRLLTTTALLTALAATPALAQTQESKPGDSQRQTQAQSAQSGSLQFVGEQKPTDWSAEALIGRTVYSMRDEELGDINNVIVSEDGQVYAITIGAGGFLGIGEKDVGVPFSALEFRAMRSDASASSGAGSSGYGTRKDDMSATSTSSNKQATQSGSSPSQQDQAQTDSKAQPQSGSQPSQQDQAQTDSKAQPQSGMSGASRSSSTQAQSGQPDPRPRGEANLADRYDSEHENVRIYLDANKEQLENAPEFVWLSDQRDSTQGNQSGNQ